MSDTNYVQYALIELWWVVVLIGGPALIAVLWESHKTRKARKNAALAMDAAARQGLIDRRRSDRRSNVVPFVPRQRSNDDHIFEVVEEYRNDAN